MIPSAIWNPSGFPRLPPVRATSFSHTTRPRAPRPLHAVCRSHPSGFPRLPPVRATSFSPRCATGRSHIDQLREGSDRRNGRGVADGRHHRRAGGRDPAIGQEQPGRQDRRRRVGKRRIQIEDGRPVEVGRHVMAVLWRAEREARADREAALLRASRVRTHARGLRGACGVSRRAHAHSSVRASAPASNSASARVSSNERTVWQNARTASSDARARSATTHARAAAS